MIINNASPQTLHARYCALTGLHIDFTMPRNWVWEQWLARGWTQGDLLAVINWVKTKNKAGGKYSLGFRNLIQDTEHFEELLAMARANARVVRAPIAKAATLRATGRDDNPPPTQAAIDAGARASELLKSFKQKLKDNE